jgi:signal peptidase
MIAQASSAHSSRARGPAVMAARGLGTLALAAAVLVLGATYVPSLLGYQRYVLVGRSMEPTIHRGSLVFDEIVPVSALRRGDVVTYVPPGMSKPLSHRIVSLRRGADGQLQFRTKGDNNPTADPGHFTFRRSSQARVRFSVPVVGWVYILLTMPGLRVWLAGGLVALLAAWTVAGLWREGGALLREQAGAP